MRYVTADNGSFIDPETGEVISVEDMMKERKKEKNVHKDKRAGTKNAGTGKKAILGQVDN